MPLAAGMRVGHYETFALVAGGTGGICRVPDTRLGRTGVTPKVARLVASEKYTVLALPLPLMGDPQGVPEGFAKHASIIDTIAWRISDARLTATSVNSPAIAGDPTKNAVPASHHDT